MRFLFAAAAFLLALQGSARFAQAAEAVEVNIDQAKIMELPDSTLTIIVGNPLIVDVTMLKSGGKVVLTGKGFGETNLLAVDRTGAVVSETSVIVKGASANVVLQRGLERESYHCSPRCQPVVALGDAQRPLNDAVGQISTRNAAETGALRR